MDSNHHRTGLEPGMLPLHCGCRGWWPVLISGIRVSVIPTQGAGNTAQRLLATNHRNAEAATSLGCL